MRVGVNPEKFKNDINHRYLHRVILPVYIPDVKDIFYKDSLLTFKLCLETLLNTINPFTTSITVVNNNSCSGVTEIIKANKTKIDKYVTHLNNKGKINAVLQEARGAYEPFVTITDADVLFYKGWEKAVMAIFNNFPRAGVVSPLPCPNLALYQNSALFYDTFWSKSLSYQNILKEEDTMLYLKGMNNSSLFNRSRHTYNWDQRQYVLSSNSLKAVVGAGHFIATYKTVLFQNEKSFPSNVFVKGEEIDFMDNLSDKKGFYRLSTDTTYAYHLGNTIDEEVIKQRHKMDGLKVEPEDFEVTNVTSRGNAYRIRKIIFKVLNRILKF